MEVSLTLGECIIGFGRMDAPVSARYTFMHVCKYNVGILTDFWIFPPWTFPTISQCIEQFHRHSSALDS